MEITTINVVYYSFELLKEPTHPWLLIYLSTEEEMTSDSTESNELEMRRIKRPLSPLKEGVWFGYRVSSATYTTHCWRIREPATA